jgi:hypothetical protein
MAKAWRGVSVITARRDNHISKKPLAQYHALLHAIRARNE